MGKQEKKWQRIYDLLNAETKPKFLCLAYTKKKKKLRKRAFCGKEGIEGWTKTKRRLLTPLATAIKKGQRRHANELKVHEKTEDSN